MSICGIAVTDGAVVQAPELEAMTHFLAPGNGQSRLKPHVGLSACKGSVSCFADRLWVVCDADLYGDEPPAGEDSAACIARLYSHFGVSFLERLRGGFALAIWDHRSRSLLLAVDRFGIKRLCYAVSDSAIVFASRPTAILAGGRMPKKVNSSAIVDYFVFNTIPAPHTAFAGVGRVCPGEYQCWTEKGIQPKRYWDMSYPEDASGHESPLARDLLSQMRKAVDKTSSGLEFSKTGCFLSGGTDSSSIVGLLTELRQTPVSAFSIGFSEDRFNEINYARLAAKHFQSRHVEAMLGVRDMAGVIAKIVAGYDEPYANSSVIPTFWCAKLAREHGMEVLLAGDGGDELFGGNERYRKEQIFLNYQTIPQAMRRWIVEPLVFGAPLDSRGVEKLRNYIRTANMTNPDRYCRWRLLQKYPPEAVFGSELPFRNGHSDLLAAMRFHYKRAPAHSELNRLLYVDVKMTLGDDDLPKVTRTAELAGIRVRFPYLDHEVAEFSGRLPASLKVKNLEKRYLFKLATRELLPQTIRDKKKHGFGLPIGIWLKTDPQLHAWAKEILFDPKTYQRGYFRREFIEQLFASLADDETPYFGDLLWVFVMFELWHRRHVEGGSS